jgi:tetratricopeptide (TPR) repeat protein
MSSLKPGVNLAIAFILFIGLFSTLAHAQTFAVQAGAFHDVTNAAAVKELLIALDYPVVEEAVTTNSGKALTQIMIGPFGDREKAASTLTHLKSKGFDGFVRAMPPLQKTSLAGAQPPQAAERKESVSRAEVPGAGLNADASGGDKPPPPPGLAQTPQPEEARPKQNALDYFADGVEALDMQDFEAAERCFHQALSLEPDNMEFQYYLAIVQVRLKKDAEALQLFESLIKKDPRNYFKAYFDIAAVYSSQGRYQEALDALDLAEQADPASARVYLEKGYVYKNLKEYDQAIHAFNRAKELDPKETQLVYYMIGAVDMEREKFENADLMFKKAMDIAPDTPLGQSARQTIPNVAQAAWARKPWYLTTTLNWGYDDNVPRNPIEEITGGPVSGGLGQSDQFETFVLIGGYKFLNQKDMEIGAGYSLFSLGYRDWTENNVTSHSPHAYFQGNFHPVYFRFQYDFSYFYAGGKKQSMNPPIYLTFANNSYAKLRMHSFVPTISILEPYNLRTDINLSYQIKDYLDGVTADASRYGADITQSYKIPGTDCYPRVGYRHAYERSGDKSSVYRYHEFFVGFNTPIYWGIAGDISFSYMRTDYPEFSVPVTDRLDKTYTVSVILNRYIIERLLLTFNYLHIRNDSDYYQDRRDLYTFNKNMYILTLTYSF